VHFALIRVMTLRRRGFETRFMTGQCRGLGANVLAAGLRVDGFF